MRESVRCALRLDMVAFTALGSSGAGDVSVTGAVSPDEPFALFVVFELSAAFELFVLSVEPVSAVASPALFPTAVSTPSVPESFEVLFRSLSDIETLPLDFP